MRPSNHPGMEKALLGMWVAMDGLREAMRHADGDEECLCLICAEPYIHTDCQTTHQVIRTFEALLHGNMVLPAELRELWDAEFPPVDELLRLLAPLPEPIILHA